MKISDIFTKVDKLTADETRKLMNNKDGGITLVDVREHAEYEAGHIPGTLLMPLSGLLNDINKLDKSKKIVTYCRRGPRSRSAAALLKRQGFGDVLYLEGGIDYWNGLVASGQYEAGLSLLEGRKSAEDLIALAWSLEDGTGKFYSQMIELSGDDEAKNLFRELVKAELAHKSKLLDISRTAAGVNVTEETVKAKPLEDRMEGGVSVQDTVSWIRNNNSDLRDILELSMQIEANSLDLYMKMQREIENESVKTAFEVLIDEEKRHLSKLGKLLDSKITKEGY